jgi:CDP-glucose 4,6-dehydratase
MNNKNNFWFGKRVLITGGDGFVASHLIKKLLGFGAYVVITVRHKRPVHTLDLLRKDDSDVKVRPDIEQCDLLDFGGLRKVCDRHQIDTIFHLAASTIVSDAANSPVSTIENNVMGTLNVLEVARINKISRVLMASSDKSYGDHADNDDLELLPYNESYALRGLDVYSSSKVAADMITQTYSYQYKVPALVVRACNIYGPGDLNFTRLIPKTIMCLLSGKSPQINKGSETVLREYIYVGDVVDSYLFLMEKVSDYYGKDNCNMPRSGKSTYGWAAFNVGSYNKEDIKNLENCKNIRNVVQVIDFLKSKILDVDSVIKEKPANFIEIPDQYNNSFKIIELGFKPKVNFEEGINRSIEWYKDNYDYLEKIAYKYINNL